MNMDAETIDTPYRSVRHAISRAFAGEERVICKSPTLMGSRSGDSDMTPHDHAAQDAIVVSLVHRYCRDETIAAVTAQNMPDSLTRARGLTLTKHGAIRVCAEHLRSRPTFADYPMDYIIDVVRQWAGILPVRNESDWIDALGKSSRTLRNIKQGNRQRGTPGIMPVLDDLLDNAHRVMMPEMRRRRMIP